jgi:hypothetical protein
MMKRFAFALSLAACSANSPEETQWIGLDALVLPSAAVAPPRASPLVLDADPLVAGAPATITVRGASAGAQVLLARSQGGIGAGPCLPGMPDLCLDVAGSVAFTARPIRADAAGTATLRFTVPAGMAGQILTMQAFVVGERARPTNPVQRPIAPAGTALTPGVDADLDGVAHGAGDCADWLPDRRPGAPDPFGDGADLDCDGWDGTAARASIGPAGGQLNLPGGAQLVVPAGALTRTVDLSLAEVTPPGWASEAPLALAGRAFAVFPAGMAVAGQVTLPVDPAALAAWPDPRLGLGWAPEGAPTLPSSSLDRGAGVMRADVTSTGRGVAVVRPRDADGDGDASVHEGGTDCDDLDPARSGQALEACGGADEDCDGRIERFVAIDAAGDTVCGIDEIGAITCWGVGVLAQPQLPPGPYVEVRAQGEGNACGKDTNGVWTCSGPGLPPGAWTDLDVGASQFGIDAAGAMSCVGRYGCPPPLVGPWSRVDGNGGGGCAVSTAGAVSCWNFGNVVAVPADAQANVADVNVGFATACALRQNGSVVCWDWRSGTLPVVHTGPYIDVRVTLKDDHVRNGVCLRTAAAGWTCDAAAAVTLPPDTVDVTAGAAVCALDAGGTPHCDGTLAEPPALRQLLFRSEVGLTLDGRVWAPPHAAPLRPEVRDLAAQLPPASLLGSGLGQELCVRTLDARLVCTDSGAQGVRQVTAGPVDDVYISQAALCWRNATTGVWACDPGGQDVANQARPWDRSLQDRGSPCKRSCAISQAGSLRCWEWGPNGLNWDPAPDSGWLEEACLDPEPSGEAVALINHGYEWIVQRSDGTLDLFGGQRSSGFPRGARASDLLVGGSTIYAWTPAGGVELYEDLGASFRRLALPAATRLIDLEDCTGPEGHVCGLDAQGRRTSHLDLSAAPHVCHP